MGRAIDVGFGFGPHPAFGRAFSREERRLGRSGQREVTAFFTSPGLTGGSSEPIQSMRIGVAM